MFSRVVWQLCFHIKLYLLSVVFLNKSKTLVIQSQGNVSGVNGLKYWFNKKQWIDLWIIFLCDYVFKIKKQESPQNLVPIKKREFTYIDTQHTHKINYHQVTREAECIIKFLLCVYLVSVTLHVNCNKILQEQFDAIFLQFVLKEKKRRRRWR